MRCKCVKVNDNIWVCLSECCCDPLDSPVCVWNTNIQTNTEVNVTVNFWICLCERDNEILNKPETWQWISERACKWTWQWTFEHGCETKLWWRTYSDEAETMLETLRYRTFYVLSQTQKKLVMLWKANDQVRFLFSALPYNQTSAVGKMSRPRCFWHHSSIADYITAPPYVKQRLS